MADLRGALTAVACTLLAAPTARAVEVELKPGDDVASLTSSMQAGDVFVFTGGTYELESGLTWSGEGTEAEPIRMVAKAGEVPVIQISGGSAVVRVLNSTYLSIEGLTLTGDSSWDVEDSGAYWFGLWIDTSSHITVQDVEIKNTTRQGLLASGDGEGLVVRRTHIHHVLYDDGLYAGCGNSSCAQRDGLIENLWIHDLQGSQADGIEIGPTSSGFEVLDNVVYNSADGGIATKSTNFGEPNVVEGNVVWGVGNEGLNIDGGAIVRNNIVFNSQGYGIRSEPSEEAGTGAVVLSHNTVVGTGRAGIYLRKWSGAEGMVLANNAVTNVTGTALDVSVGEGTHVVGNVVTGLVTGLDAGFVGGGGLDDYVDAEEWNYWPSDASHLVNAADTAAESWVPSLDFNGQPRPGDAPDVGALERDRATNPGWQIREGFKEPTVDAGAGGSETVESGCGCGADEEPVAGALLFVGLLGLRRRRGARS